MYSAKRLQRYKRICDLISRLEEEKKVIREELISTPPDSIPSTWSVKVTRMVKERLVGITDIKDRSMKLYDTLVKNGFIYESEETRVTVKPVPREP